MTAFYIRRVHDDVLPDNRDAIEQVQRILAEQFDAVPRREIDQLAEKLRNPFKQQFRTLLYVATNNMHQVQGFALMMHEPVIEFCFLDYIASASGKAGRGIGGALYDRVRRDAKALGAKGLFFECLPDDPHQCSDPRSAKQNAARLKFYEAFGAYPIEGTAYQAPIRPDDSDMPLLVFDGLDRDRPLSRHLARKAVRAILERKYGHLCPPEYIEMVVASFRDDPVRLRAPRYVPVKQRETQTLRLEPDEQIGLVINAKHDIHHLRERGYVESPVRIKSILQGILPMDAFTVLRPKAFPQKVVESVHDADFVSYLKRACNLMPPGKSLYPYVFPIRNAAKPPKDLAVRAGYYCIDTFTPLNRNAYLAARRAVDCTLTAAEELLHGRRVVYSLVRPPGHHAERRSFGGFCYFNNNAIAAQYLSRLGKVAILDLDFHHGNGQQDIFYTRNDVLTVSIHGHPSFAYPYFSGFAEERGAEAGEGFSHNFPLPENIDAAAYHRTLEKAIKIVADFQPMFLVLALGFDTALADPTGTWPLRARDFAVNGRMVAQLGLPTLVVQEGGYRVRTLGTNARSFFEGMLRYLRL